MARTVPGSGAVIKPIFDEFFGVRAIEVLDGGSGYDPTCLLYTSPSPRDQRGSRMPSSA